MTCPACFGAQFTARTLFSGMAVHTCVGCGLLVSEITGRGPVAPEFARINERAYRHAVGGVRKLQAKEILSLVQEHRPPGNSWLDIGCGFGYLLREAQQAGYQVTGIEPDDRAVTEARKLLSGDSRTTDAGASGALGESVIQQGLMREESVPDSSAAIISMLDVLEHVPADKLSSFARMIRSKLILGGLWVIKVPSTEGLYFTLGHLFPFFTPEGVLRRLWQLDYEFPHTVYFNSHSLGRYLENHGFQVVAQRYIADVSNDTVMDRLRMDDTIPAWQARLLAPAFYGINAVEQMRGKSDAMLMLGKSSTGMHPSEDGPRQ